MRPNIIIVGSNLPKKGNKDRYQILSNKKKIAAKKFLIFQHNSFQWPNNYIIIFINVYLEIIFYIDRFPINLINAGVLPSFTSRRVSLWYVGTLIYNISYSDEFKNYRV